MSTETASARVALRPFVLVALGVLLLAAPGSPETAHAADPVSESRISDPSPTRTDNRANAPQTAENILTEPVEFLDGDNRLSGVLSLPASPAPFPAVVFLTGSDAEDRTYGGVATALARHFARQGIASLAWDKPGVGKSTGDYQRQTLEERAREALAAVHFLQERSQIRRDQVGIWGHSQGGMVAPLAASRSKDVAFVVEVAGWQGPAWQQDLIRVEMELRAAGFDEAQVRKATDFARHRMDLFRGTEAYETLEKAQAEVRDEPWFKHVHWCDRKLFEYARRNVGYDSTTWWEEVHCPVLVIYGGRDVSAGPPERHVNLIRRGLNKAGNRDAIYRVFPDADHSLRSPKTAGQESKKQPAAAGASAEPDFVEGYLEAMSDWIRSRQKPAPPRPENRK